MKFITRYKEDDLDEIVAENVDIHVEWLDNGVWWLGIYTKDGKTHHLKFVSDSQIYTIFDENC